LSSFSILFIVDVSDLHGHDDLDLARFASLMFPIASDLFGCGPHVDHHFLFPFFMLQLVATFLDVVILILVVLVLSFL
jgi:hypothetical protein